MVQLASGVERYHTVKISILVAEIFVDSAYFSELEKNGNADCEQNG